MLLKSDFEKSLYRQRAIKANAIPDYKRRNQRGMVKGDSVAEGITSHNNFCTFLETWDYDYLANKDHPSTNVFK